jgi:hypothetical protein
LRTKSKKAPTDLWVYVDAGSSGTRMNLAVDPDCKVKDEKYGDD